MEGGDTMSEQDETRQLRRRACCLTGHRVLPSDPDERMELTHNLRKTVARLAQEGIQVFYTGGALGFDTLAAVTVLELKAQFPQIQLYLAVPYPGQSQYWSKLDTRLYAVFHNVMEQNFDRKKGTLSVYRLNYDGTEGAYELEYDLTNAYDEEGKLNKNMEIDAQLKVAETMQSNINYGQGSREIYTSYDQYAETLDWLKSPLLCDGFALQNFSSLTLTEEENGIWRITATYTPEALRELYDQDIDGVVTSFIELDKDGNLQLLRWEQTEEVNDYPTVIACGEYSFS